MRAPKHQNFTRCLCHQIPDVQLPYARHLGRSSPIYVGLLTMAFEAFYNGPLKMNLHTVACFLKLLWISTIGLPAIQLLFVAPQ